MPHPNASLPAQIHAAFGWWQEAGVDLNYSDDVTDWLAQQDTPPSTQLNQGAAIASAPADAAHHAKKVALLGDNPPQDLASFRDWWLTEPTLDPVGLRGRIPPQGQTQADLMVVVMTPEEGDTQSLLSGSQGKLFDGFLRAAGLGRDQIYLASALPRHIPVADGSAVKSAGYGEVLRHHIKLAAPKRLLIFGKSVLPLLGHEAAQEPAVLQIIGHEDHRLPLLAVEGLGSMQTMPRLKARFWRKWLDWTDD